MNYRLKRIIYISFLLFIASFYGCKKTNNNTIEKVVPLDTSVTYPIKLNAVIPEYNTNYGESLKDFKAYVNSNFPKYDASITTVKGGIDAYDTKLRVLQATKDVPDIMYCGGEKHVKQLLEDDKVIRIDKYLDKIEFWDSVIPAAKVKGYKGDIYAIPFDDMSFEIIQYNSEIFNENNLSMPTTFYDLKRIVEVLKTKDIIPIALGGKDGYTAAMMMEGFAYTVDPEITTNIINGKAKFSDDPYKIAAARVKELKGMNAFETDVQKVSDAEAAQLYYDGKAAMYCSSLDNFKISNEKLEGKSCIMYYPVLNSSDRGNYGKACAGGVRPDSGLFISSESKYPADAVKLSVEMSKYYSKYLYEEKNYPMIIYNQTAMRLNINNKVPLTLTKFMNNVKSFKTSTGFIQDVMPNDEAVKIMNDSSTAFIHGFINVDSYLKEMDTAIEVK